MATLKLFKIHLRVPFLLLALLEFCICVAAVYVAIYVRFDGADIDEVSINSVSYTHLTLPTILRV